MSIFKMTGWVMVFCEGRLSAFFPMFFVSFYVGGRTTKTGKAPNWWTAAPDWNGLQAFLCSSSWEGEGLHHWREHPLLSARLQVLQRAGQRPQGPQLHVWLRWVPLSEASGYLRTQNRPWISLCSAYLSKNRVGNSELPFNFVHSSKHLIRFAVLTLSLKLKKLTNQTLGTSCPSVF